MFLLWTSNVEGYFNGMKAVRSMTYWISMDNGKDTRDEVSWQIQCGLGMRKYM